MDPRIVQFRTAINEWKRSTFFPQLVEENDSESIDRRIQQAHAMYYVLVDAIQKLEVDEEDQTEKTNPLQEGGQQEVEAIVSKLNPMDTLTESDYSKIRSILFTDLYEYPLTFNTSLIDQFKQEPNFQRF